MANVERVKKAIAAMTRVRDRGDKLNMKTWQDSASAIKTKEQYLHQCGTAACFAGWLAVSPEFQADGGRPRPFDGAPVFEDVVGSKAIAHYLEISYFLARGFCATSAELHYCKFYGVEYIYEITPQHVINKLQELII